MFAATLPEFLCTKIWKTIDKPEIFRMQVRYALRRRMHRTVILAKCVMGWKEECGLEGAGRVFVGCLVLRTSA